MTQIADLLDGVVKQEVQALVIAVTPDQPAKQHILKARHAGEPDIIITKPSTARPNGAIVIDHRSESLIDANCVDCKVSIQIDPKVPEGVDPEAPRIPLCVDCGKARVKAMDGQRNVETIRRTTTAKHKPRTSDGINHPVTTTKKEQDMTTDLDNMTDAELGAMVRTQMKAVKAEAIIEAAPAVEEERREAAAAEVEAVAEVQTQPFRTVMYAGFEHMGVVVPVLDLTNVSTLDEMPSGKERSAYNKVLNRKNLPILDKDTCTYADLVAWHETLQRDARTEVEPKAKAKKAKKDKALNGKEIAAIVNSEPKQTLVVAVDHGDQAKVTALAEVLGVSEKKARKIVASMAGRA